MPRRGKNHEIVECASAIEVTADGTSMQHVRLLPLGEFRLRDNRTRNVWRVENPQEIIKRSLAAAGKQDLPVDYDHQLLFAAGAGKGGTAVASGWIKNLTAEADGIYADIEWTETAAAKIKAKEYRYISPSVALDANNSVVRIANAGLTNDPAIDGLDVLAASLNHENEDEMDLTELAVTLGLPKTASLEEITAEQKRQAAQLAAASAQLGAVAVSVGLKANADVATIIATASKVQTAKFASDTDVIVPASVWNDTTEKLKAHEKKTVESAVEAACAEGKITPAQKPSMLEWASKDYDAFSKFVAASAPFKGGDQAAQNDDKNGATSFTAEELEGASFAGVTPEEYRAEKARLEA